MRPILALALVLGMGISPALANVNPRERVVEDYQPLPSDFAYKQEWLFDLDAPVAKPEPQVEFEFPPECGGLLLVRIMEWLFTLWSDDFVMPDIVGTIREVDACIELHSKQ